MTKNYTNRNGDVYTFTTIDPNIILWEGPFNLVRVSSKLDYTNAFLTFKENFPESSLNMSQFKLKVYAWDYENKTYILGSKYRKLITPINNEYEVVDPMGGPYIAIDMFLEIAIGTGTVASITKVPTGYEIKTKRHNE